MLKQNTDPERESLRALTGVYVTVGEPSKAFINAGITAEKLETAVEVKLSVAGIRLLSFDELKNCQQGLPYLHILARGFKIPGVPALEREPTMIRFHSYEEELTARIAGFPRRAIFSYGPRQRQLPLPL